MSDHERDLLTAESLAGIELTEYSMNFDNLKNHEYARVWITAGIFKDFILMIEKFEVNEKDEDVSTIKFQTEVVSWPDDLLTKEEVSAIVKTDEYKRCMSWIVDDMLRRATSQVEDQTQEVCPPQKAVDMMQDLDFDSTYRLQ